MPTAVKRYLLPFILLSALLLRLYHINQPYTDLAGWRQSSVAMMAENFHNRNPNILYPEISWNGPGKTYTGYEFQTVSYAANLLYWVFGQHEWIGRLINVLFGVWGIFALYQLVRRAWDETHALVSAAVLALLPGVIFFDRTFLPDPAMVSLVTTASWFLIAYLQTDNRRYFIGMLLTGCLGFLTKIPGMLILLPMLYAILSILSARKKLSFRNLAMLAVPALLVILIVAAYYLWARHIAISYPPYLFAGHSNWVWNEGLSAWLQQGYFLEKTTFIFKNWILGAPFCALFVAGIFSSFIYIKSAARNAANQVKIAAPYFFHFWLIGYIVFYAIGAKEQIDNFWNFHIGTPMIAAFCSSALVFVWQFFKDRRWVSVAAGLLLFAYIVRSDYKAMSHTFLYKHYQTDYYMGLSLKKLRQPNDLVVVLSHDIGCPIAVFYSGGRGWVFPPHDKANSDQLPPNDAACKALLQELIAQGAGWFAINRDQYNTFIRAYPLFTQYLNTNCTLRSDEPDYVIFQLPAAGR